MSDFDAKTVQFLTSLKLNHKLQYLSDFQSGYAFGLIFQRLNLLKGYRFKNSSDMPCVFHNYKITKDLLKQNFGIDFPIANIMYRSEELLKVVRDACIKIGQERKLQTMKSAVEGALGTSKISGGELKMFKNRQKQITNNRMSATAKLPQKILQIETKLEKFREEKTKHELLALQQRKNQIEESRRLIQQHRQFQLSKLRMNHEFMKEHEKKVYDIWQKTETIKHQRIQKDNAHNNFMESKKIAHQQSLRADQVKFVQNGLQAFQLNCIRQGIELEHDPDKQKHVQEDQHSFNGVVVMERIRDNIKNHEKQRKERIKRQNKKNVDAEQAKIKSQAIWNENQLVQDYSKKMNAHLKVIKTIQVEKLSEQAQKNTIKQKYQNKVFVDLPSSLSDPAQRQEELRHNRIIYLDAQVQRLTNRWNKHKIIAQDALQAFLQIVIENQDQLQEGIPFGKWKSLEKAFLGYKKEGKMKIFQNAYLDGGEGNVTKYLKKQAEWSVQYNEEQQSTIDQCDLPSAISSLISICYPELPQPEPSSIPLYMPLRLALTGCSTSAIQTSLSTKLAHKYGLLYINPSQIIKQALESAKEVVVEDPKKKKDPKKVEQQSPEKKELKQFGQRLSKELQSAEHATIHHIIQAILFKLKAFHNKNQAQQIHEFNESKQQQTQRFAKAMKDYEQLQKKGGKKDAKKGAVTQVEEVPTERKYFWTKGFILDGVELNEANARQLQKQLNGYIPFLDRLNPSAETLKKTLSTLLPLPPTEVPSNLTPSLFSAIISCHPQSSPITHFYSSLGQQKRKEGVLNQIKEGSEEETLAEIVKLLEFRLDGKYADIRHIEEELKKEKQDKPSQNHSEEPEQIAKDEAKDDQTHQKASLSSFISALPAPAIAFISSLLPSLPIRHTAKTNTSLSFLPTSRQYFGESLQTVQQQFLSIINRPDDKAGKILSFQESYNKLLSQKGNLVKDGQASKHLITKLDELYDGLWGSLEVKKNDAVAYRLKFINSDWLNLQVFKLVEAARSLLQNQLNFLIDLLFFLLSLNCAAQGITTQIPPEYTSLGIAPSNEPIAAFTSDLQSPRLKYYLASVDTILAELPDWLKKKQKKFKVALTPFISSLIQSTLRSYRIQMQHRAHSISSVISRRMLEYAAYHQALVNKMDDWIIIGIKNENEFVYDIYKTIKKNILQAKKSNVRDLFAKQITQTLFPIYGMTYQCVPVSPLAQKPFPELSFLTLYLELQSLSLSNRIPLATFRTYYSKRIKSSLLHPLLLRIDFDTLEQYLVTDGFFNWKEMVFALLFPSTQVIPEEQIEKWRRTLCGDQKVLAKGQAKGETKADQPRVNNQISANQQQQINGGQLIPTPSNQSMHSQPASIPDKPIPYASFSLPSTFPNSPFNLPLVFSLFKEEYSDNLNLPQMIELLRTFDRLQMARYGDAIMMLGHHHQGGRSHRNSIEDKQLTISK